MLQPTENSHIKYDTDEGKYIVYDETSANIIAVTDSLQMAQFELRKYMKKLEASQKRQFTLADLRTYVDFELASQVRNDDYDKGWADCLEDLKTKLALIKE